MSSTTTTIITDNEKKPVHTTQPKRKTHNPFKALFLYCCSSQPADEDGPEHYAKYARYGYKETTPEPDAADYQYTSTIGTSRLGDHKSKEYAGKKITHRKQPRTQLGVSYFLAPSPLGIGP